jgi:hypothetical protein
LHGADGISAEGKPMKAIQLELDFRSAITLALNRTYLEFVKHLSLQIDWQFWRLI